MARPRVRWVDVLTVSRGATGAGLLAAAVRGRTTRQGRGGWLAWCALVLAAIPADWLDGPLARRAGPSWYGEVLDLESDSLLSLGSAAAAARWGGLPAYAVVPAVTRYPLLATALRGSTYSGVNRDHPTWARPVGMAQMTLFIAALAPFGGSLTRAVVTVAAPIVGIAQQCVLLAVYGRRR